MRRNSLKRTKQLKEYIKVKKEFIYYKKLIGEFRCIFCGRPIKEEFDIHHLFGREEKKLINSINFEIAHKKCHRDYHSKSTNKLPWFYNYLLRIRYRHPILYQKEIEKMSK